MSYHFCGESVEKKYQFAPCGIRPLPYSILEYAALDAWATLMCLIAMKTELEDTFQDFIKNFAVGNTYKNQAKINEALSKLAPKENDHVGDDVGGSGGLAGASGGSESASNAGVVVAGGSGGAKPKNKNKNKKNKAAEL